MYKHPYLPQPKPGLVERIVRGVEATAQVASLALFIGLMGVGLFFALGYATGILR
jgi:hypothetical protein